MSRYLGPRWRKSRALNLALLDGREFSKGKKRSSPPGIHGKKTRRIKSSYGLQNQEKQKLRFLYGLREKQLQNLFLKLKKRKIEDLGFGLLRSCESRLDNLVFRSGIVTTRSCARQLVSHGHFLVDKSKVKTPSFQLRCGQVITLRSSKLCGNRIIKESLKRKKEVPSFLVFDQDKIIATYVREPTEKDKEIQEIRKGINTSLIIEWCDRKI